MIGESVSITHLSGHALVFHACPEADFFSDTYYDGIVSPEQMKDMYQHFIGRNSKQGQRDLSARALGIGES